MSAVEMREAAAKLCDGYRGDARVEAYDARASAADDMCETLAAAIRALPLPDEEGMVEKVARALWENNTARTPLPEKYWLAGKSHWMSQARAALRAINGGEP